MRKVIISLVIAFAIGLVLFIIKPWDFAGFGKPKILLSSQPFTGKSNPEETIFPQNSYIYYSIKQKSPFPTSMFTIQIFEVQGQNSEILLRERVEKDIKSNSNHFTFVLRPDFFEKPGDYKMKVFFGNPVEKNRAAEVQFQIISQ